MTTKFNASHPFHYAILYGLAGDTDEQNYKAEHLWGLESSSATSLICSPEQLEEEHKRKKWKEKAPAEASCK